MAVVRACVLPYSLYYLLHGGATVIVIRTYVSRLLARTNQLSYAMWSHGESEG